MMRSLSVSKRLAVSVTFRELEYDAAKKSSPTTSLALTRSARFSVAKVVEGDKKRKITVAIGTTVELEDAKVRKPSTLLWVPQRQTLLSTRFQTSRPQGRHLSATRRATR